MEKFLKQFALTPMQRIHFEAFIFRMADRNIKGYMGGNWESKDIGGATILMIPGKDDEQVTMTIEMSGNVVTTDRLTASAAFTCLVNNWFWNAMTEKLSEPSNLRFYTLHHALRNTVYADNAKHGINIDDYFTITD